MTAIRAMLLQSLWYAESGGMPFPSLNDLATHPTEIAEVDAMRRDGIVVVVDGYVALRPEGYGLARETATALGLWDCRRTHGTEPRPVNATPRSAES